MTKRTKRIRYFLEYALNKFTLYLGLLTSHICYNMTGIEVSYRRRSWAGGIGRVAGVMNPRAVWRGCYSVRRTCGTVHAECRPR